MKINVNVSCLIFFSIFFTLCFMIHTGSTDFDWFYYYQGEISFWKEWSYLLQSNLHVGIALALDVFTLPIVLLLIQCRKTYDKQQVSILLSRLVMAICMFFLPMAVSYILIFGTNIFNGIPWIAGKFTFFVIVHWIIVLLINIIFIIHCHRKQSL